MHIVHMRVREMICEDKDAELSLFIWSNFNLTRISFLFGAFLYLL